MSNPLKSARAKRALLLPIALLDLYGWCVTAARAAAGQYTDGVIWCLGAVALGYGVVRDWRRWGG
ncbi:hypothetical protein [Kitasatospora sp. MAP5-34]|uniref:hypothetical protein n=1 Tax=Kitasatospora sp. MAP5-34 TaxID=3035102 RepID=UPI002475A4CB|nr:hypothetical protein [Kitasatospora sp. MAP5-34]MDH6577057.1 hypothetical protein [Kitasatospora sp. MAP5-34]